MYQLFVTLLAAYGLCFGLMNDKVAWFTRGLRRIPVGVDESGRNLFARMLECPYCTGFHTGYLAWFAVTVQDVVAAPSWVMILQAIVMAFASSATCYLLDIGAEWLETTRTPE
jgi:hypothetical protein